MPREVPLSRFYYDRDRDPPDRAVADSEVVPLRGGYERDSSLSADRLSDW